MSLARSLRLIGRSWLAGLTILAGAMATGSVASGASRPAFYDPPAQLPAGGPGTLVRAERSSFRGLTKPAVGTRGWRMLYLSTGATGERTVVSGTLLEPPRYDPSRGIVSYAVGTHGMGDQCAPSRLLQSGAENDLLTITDLLSRGYAVAVTDYQGLGTPGAHAFAVNNVLGRNVLDVVRAARALPDAGLEPSGKVGLVGYSEGGGAVGSAAEQAATYAPELGIVGTVAGSMLADPYRAIRTLDGNVFMGLALAGLAGYDDAYPDLELAPYLRPAGRGAIRSVGDACLELIAGFAFNRVSWYTTRSPFQLPEWKQRMQQNAVGARLPNAPVYLYHGRFDEVLPSGQSTGVRNAWCAAGANVRFRMSPFGEHVLTQLLEQPAAFAWLADRFAGKPATPNC